MQPELPIHAVIPEILGTLRTNTSCILEAPPGAGKTTIVPLALLNEAWLGTSTIILVEPRRIAAKAAARRMASLLNEEVGQTVGYRMRMETCVGPNTRIEVVTEGILTRRLAHDPTLEGVGIVIFDEVHERSLQADTGLAFTLMTREMLRPDLKLLLMSATLASIPLQVVLPDAPTVRSLGSMFPVETVYLAKTPERPLPQEMAAAVERACSAYEGDVLCFLPGFAEQRSTKDLLDAHSASLHGAEVLLLHGNLSTEEQDNALRPAGRRRRVILSTAIAETSVTIDGVRVVIDGGFSREPRFDTRSGLTHLTTVSVSQDAAEQRRGRAGRTSTGTCLRLWTQQQNDQLPQRRTPEILISDLSSMVLEAAAIGIDPANLAWIDKPPASALRQAQELLHDLHAIGANGTITEHGKAMLRHGAHPRVANMLVEAARLGLSRSTAASVAALLGERDILKGARDVDIRRRVDVLAGVGDLQSDRGAVAAARRRRDHFRIGKADELSLDDVGPLLALAYPDRVAISKGKGRFMMRNGRTVRVDESDVLSRCEWLAVADVEGSTSDARIVLAAPLDKTWVERIFRADVELRDESGWNAKEQRIVAREVEALGSIVLAVHNATTIAPDVVRNVWTELITSWGIDALPWTPEAQRLRERVMFAHANACAPVPDWSDEALLQTIGDWLAPSLESCRTWKDLQNINMATILRDSLPHGTLVALNRAAPDLYKPPKGREVHIDYSNPEQPTIAVRLQFMFGVRSNPKVANGNIPLTVELLSPADRPIQKTRNLGGFWTGSYADVRKEMKGRYPKHDWPEKP